MSKYDYVLFDLDGTLLDTEEGVISAAVHAMEKYERIVPSQDILESFIGPPIQDSFQRVYNLSDDEAMEMANVFRNAYKTDDFLFKAVPYNGIFELMRTLIDSGIKVGIATYKREDYAKKLLIKKGFDTFVKHMHGADFEGKLKKVDIIKQCLDDMECDNVIRAVYIGDSISDGKAANEVGIDFIAVTYGYGFKKPEDANTYYPIFVASTCSDICRFLIEDI